MRRRIDDEMIMEVARRIAIEFKPEKIILFGSWAWGKPGPDSDVDLFIIKATADARRFAREVDGSIFPRPFPLDIIVYHPDKVAERGEMGDFFIAEIMSKGRVLYAARQGEGPSGVVRKGR